MTRLGRVIVACAAVVGLAAAAVFLLAALLAVQAGAVECQSAPGDGGSWSWRHIAPREDEKCWFQGRRVLPKSELHWPEKRPRAAAAPPAPKRPEPVAADQLNEIDKAAAPPAAPSPEPIVLSATPIERSPFSSYRPPLLDLSPAIVNPPPAAAVKEPVVVDEWPGPGSSAGSAQVGALFLAAGLAVLTIATFGLGFNVLRGQP